MRKCKACKWLEDGVCAVLKTRRPVNANEDVDAPSCHWQKKKVTPVKAKPKRRARG